MAFQFLILIMAILGSDAPALAGGTLNDGLTSDRAIVITSKEVDVAPTERAWLKEHYVGWKVVSQQYAGSRSGDREYDIITIQNPVGEVVDIYFDITRPIRETLEMFKKELEKANR